MMKIVAKPALQSNTFCNSKSYIRLREKEISSVDFKFYQKIFIVLISLSTILIFPELPRELGNICEIYNPRKICNVW